MPRLEVTSALNSQQYEQGLGRLESRTQGFSQMLGSMKGVLAGAFSIAAVTRFASSIISLGSRLTDMATQAGITTDQWQALEFATLKAGVSSDRIRTALAKVAVVMGQAQRGMKTYVDLFNEIGISQAALADMNPAQVIEQIAKVMSTAERGTSEFAAAMEIIGTRSAAQLTEVLQALADDGFGGLNRAMRESGIFIEEQVLDQLDQVADSMERIKRAAAADAAPALAWLTTTFADGLETIRNFNESLGAEAAMWLDAGISAEDYADTLNEIWNLQQRAADAPTADAVIPIEDTSEAEAAAAAMATERERRNQRIERMMERFDQQQRAFMLERLGITEQIAFVERELAQTRAESIDSTDQEALLDQATRALDLERQLFRLKEREAREQERIAQQQEQAAQRKAQIELDAAEQIAELKAGEGVSVSGVVADRLARIGGFLGGQTNPAARTAERTLQITTQIKDILARSEQQLQELNNKEQVARYAGS